MKINLSPVTYSQNIHKASFLKPNKLERTPAKDTVSFSSKKPHKKTLKPNVKTALEYSNEIMNISNKKDLSLEDIPKITSKYTENTTIHPMSKLKETLTDAENYGAYFTSHIDENFNVDAKDMYIKLPKGNPDKIEKLSFVMDCAHEFTHIKQNDTHQCFDELKLMTKGNYQYATAIMAIAETAFKPFDTQIQATHVLAGIQEHIDKQAFMKYGFIVPQEAPITRNTIYSSAGFKNENEMQKELKDNFKMVFDHVMTLFEKEHPEILAKIPKNEQYEDVMKKVKTYCKTRALDEKEAYTTEAEVARKSLETDNNLNIDAFAIYYDILAKALE